jgi:hypothetical protein
VIHLSFLASGRMMLVALVAIQTVALTAAESKPLGGVNLEEFCQRRYGGRAILISRNAYGWRCSVSSAGVSVGVGLPTGVNAGASKSGTQYAISVNEVCALQYGGGAQAQTFDSRNPYSWRCFR